MYIETGRRSDHDNLSENIVRKRFFAERLREYLFEFLSPLISKYLYGFGFFLFFTCFENEFHVLKISI